MATPTAIDNVAVEFKRWMGQKDRKMFPAANREMAAEELSAEVLKAMRHDVERATGSAPDAAVVTVPAAFGSLQCDATSRAVALAGFQECVLLQEPIAAAIAYGADPNARDQRWLVYDLGGGTLDVAVMSTRDGQLTVLEHRGDNLLGGKDIDRALVEAHILPAIASSFKLPDEHDAPDAYQLLFRRLLFKAEEAKIELSTAEQVAVSIFDVGDDLDGSPIELELTLTRAQLEGALQPIYQRTLRLAGDALSAARLQGSALTRILLVGGPTQMPFLRAALTADLSAPVDYSLDPMTVVARGAALYAASTERTRGPAQAAPATPGTLSVQLAYEPVSPTMDATIAGKIDAGSATGLEVRIDSQAGYWTSGWVPLQNGLFEIDAMLQEGKVCPFYLYVRDPLGETLPVEPNEFSIRHGLVPTSPPLPHTISIEVMRPNGRVELDPIFGRNMPLPVEKRIQYRANTTLRPGEAGGALAIKLWEGEELTEPDANEWVGNVQITSSMIRLPIPEDSELDLFIRIDTSRLITVEIFVPHLNQHFADSVYLAAQEQRDDADSIAKLTKEVASFIDRLALIDERLKDLPNPELAESLRELKVRSEDLYSDVALAIQNRRLSDPDRSRRFVAAGRDLRMQISGLEQRIGVDRRITERNKELTSTVEQARLTVEEHGEKTDRFEFEMLKRDVEQAAERLDERGVTRAIQELDKLTFRVLARHDWFWRQIFETMEKGDDAFTNPGAAQLWVAQGERAVREGNGAALREAVHKLWSLQTLTAAEAGRKRATAPGVR